MTLLERIADHLASHRISFALIGAGALAHHGVSRSTFDDDLLAMDAAVLDPAFWSGLPSDVAVDVRPGDSDDPLRGVVRCRASGERDVDIVVGRHAWQRDVLMRAQNAAKGPLPIAEAADLVLLKLYAGGSQDRWDIEQLLVISSREDIAQVVDVRVAALPQRSRDLWRQLR